MEDSNRKTRCCFTGHRPEKLAINEKEAKRLLCRGIEHALSEGFRVFITGMAQGIDIWAGELVLEFKNIYPDIKLVCALPYPTFYNGRRKEEKVLFKKILSEADFVHISYPAYNRLAYQSRNMWMVDHSGLVIAFFSGEAGGTRNTVKYAEEQGVRVLNLLN